MPETDERLDNVERRLGGVETGLTGLREEVGGLREEVGGLREEVGGLREEVGGLRGEVTSLRILGEKNTEDIKKIAEVQEHHGQKLDDIVEALKPLSEIHDFVQRVAPNHEARIRELERRAGIPQ